MQTVLEKLKKSGQFSGVYGSVLVKIAIALLIGGPDARGSELLAVDEPNVVTMKEGTQFSQHNLVWYGHQHNLTTFLLAWRFMVLNDKNKKLFMRCAMIPVCLILMLALFLITQSNSYSNCCLSFAGLTTPSEGIYWLCCGSSCNIDNPQPIFCSTCTLASQANNAYLAKVRKTVLKLTVISRCGLLR